MASGRLQVEGSCRDVISHYSHENAPELGNGELDLSKHVRADGLHQVMVRAWLTNDQGAQTATILMGAPLSLHVSYVLQRPMERPILGVQFNTESGSPVFGVDNRFISGFEIDRCEDRGTLSCHIQRCPLCRDFTTWISG